MNYYGFGYYYISNNPILEEIVAPPQVQLQAVYVNGRSLVQVDFTQDVLHNSDYFNKDLWKIEAIDGGAEVTIHEIITSTLEYSNSIQFKTSYLTRGALYRIVSEAPLEAINGTILDQFSAEFIGRMTKFDLLVSKFPSAASIMINEDDPFSHLIAIVSMSDDDIGGGSPVVP